MSTKKKFSQKLDSRYIRLVSLISTVFLALFMNTVVSAQYSCLPTCSSVDGRFLSMAHSNSLNSCPDEVASFRLVVDGSKDSFELGIFDGDGMESTGNTGARWDSGHQTLYEYAVYFDPTGLNLPDSEVWREYSSAMPNNEWHSVTLPTHPKARERSSGNFSYVLRVVRLEDNITNNNFKVRVTGQVTTFAFPEGFCFQANMHSMEDGYVIYPSFPSMHPTTYDGTFDFNFHVDTPQTDLTIWDFDFDHYKYDSTVCDSDDPDTPPGPPPFAPGSRVETAQSADSRSPFDDGSPMPRCDDQDGSDLSFYLVREPTVKYEVIFPRGCPSSFLNENPSGDREFEQFRISTDPFARSEMDHSVTEIPEGIYTMKVFGLDIQNHNHVRLPFPVLGVDEHGRPVLEP